MLRRHSIAHRANSSKVDIQIRSAGITLKEDLQGQIS